MDNYSQLVQKIAGAAKLEPADIERRVEAKRAKLSGLVSKEGAAQIVAAELGINFEKEKLKVAELVDGMKRANTAGKVIDLSPVRAFNKNGREGKVVNLVVADSTGNIKVVLWDTNHIALIENGKIQKGDSVEVSYGGVRNGELHLSSFGDIKKIKDEFNVVVTERGFKAIKLGDVKPGMSMRTRAFIVQVFDPRYFEVCPECSKKVHDNVCVVHGTVQSKRRALLNIVIDDGTGHLRAVLFGEQIIELGLTEEEIFSLEHFAEKKMKLLGEEKMFSGNVRSNALYNTTEFYVNSIDGVNSEMLLKELETKA
ncbi:MAG: hypothetical protein WCK90_02215 [archaeon]